MHLFTLFSITSHHFSLSVYFWLALKSMLALLPFKATISARHSNDKCFHRAVGDLICQFCIHPTYFQCIVGAQQEIQCLTVRTTLADLMSVTTESRNVCPCMTTTSWSRVNWKMCDENSIFACFDAICTQFSVTWPHYGTVHDFLAVLTGPDCRHESDFSQRDGSDSTCRRRVRTVHNKTPEQTSACFACKNGPPQHRWL